MIGRYTRWQLLTDYFNRTLPRSCTRCRNHAHYEYTFLSKQGRAISLRCRQCGQWTDIICESPIGHTFLPTLSRTLLARVSEALGTPEALEITCNGALVSGLGGGYSRPRRDRQPIKVWAPKGPYEHKGSNGADGDGELG